MKQERLEITIRSGDERLLVSALIPQFTKQDLEEKGEMILLLANLYLKGQHEKLLRRTTK